MGDLYKQFRAAIARQAVAVGPTAQKWVYYDSGPKDITPVVCVHGTSGSADVFYHQISSLTAKGYRVISAQYPAYFTVSDWVRGFDRFLDAMSIPKIHLLGTSLGGYLVLHYLKTYPLRMSSVILCNAFCDTQIFADNAPCVNMFRYLPEFYLKKYILDNFPSEELEHRIASAVDFVVGQLEMLDRDSIAARLTLNCMPGEITEISEFDQQKITVLDTFDAVSLPESMRDQLYNLLPNAKYAHLKSGGDFPYLSRSDEFSMLLQVHLRGVDCHPQMSDKEEASVDGYGEEESKLLDDAERQAQDEVTKRALEKKYEEQEKERRAKIRDRIERERIAEERLEELKNAEERDKEREKYERERQLRVEQYKKQKQERLRREEQERREKERREAAKREQKQREAKIFQNLLPDDSDRKTKSGNDDIFS